MLLSWVSVATTKYIFCFNNMTYLKLAQATQVYNKSDWITGWFRANKSSYLWRPPVFRSGPKICPVQGVSPQRARRASCGGTPRTGQIWVSTEIQGVVKDKTIYSRGIKPVIQSDLVCDPARKHHDQRNTVRCDLSYLAPINILVVTLVIFVHNKVVHISLRTTSSCTFHFRTTV